MTQLINWGRTSSWTPANIASPTSHSEVEELVSVARLAGMKVKARGSLHSFTPIAQTTGLQLELSGLSGLISADTTSGRVRVKAGTPLHELNRLLGGLGLALPNLGDIDRQTISGALATGTHGTGGALYGIAAAAVGFTIVTANGTVRCSETENPELLEAARINLGALGIVTEVELQTVPAFLLEAREGPEPLAQVLENYEEEAAQNRHFEFYAFPYAPTALVKRNNITDTPAPLPGWKVALEDRALSNGVFGALNRAVKRAPSLARRANLIASRTLSARTFADASYKVFCSPRNVQFAESEYAIPREALPHVLGEIRSWIERTSFATAFPMEVRFTAADSIWLSTSFGRNSAYVAIHQYHSMDYRDYFDTFGRIVAEVGGRPHWGKMHSLTASELRELYPHFDDFLAVRDRLDPDRMFTNDHLATILDGVA